MLRKGTGLVAVLALGVGVLASCGKSSRGAGMAEGAGTQATGAESGAAAGGADGLAGVAAGGSIAGSGASGGAVPASDGGAAGAATIACAPGAQVTCHDNAVATCSSDAILELDECGEGFACELDVFGAHCEGLDVPELGTTPNAFGSALRDAFMLVPCYRTEGAVCWNIKADETCPGLDGSVAPDEEKGSIFTQTFEVGGEQGTLYKLHFVVDGVAEPAAFAGGIRDRGDNYYNPNDPADLDTFYRGGVPIGDRSHNTRHKLTVLDAQGEEVAHYYLNSYPYDQDVFIDRAIPISFEKDLEVPGQGSIEYRSQSRRCNSYSTCEPSGAYEACPGLPIPNEPDLVLPETWLGQPLASFNVLTGAQQPFHASLIHLRVTKIGPSK